jgi:hypothetical protein
MTLDERIIVAVMTAMYRPVHWRRGRRFADVVARVFRLSDAAAVDLCRRFAFNASQNVGTQREVPEA